MTAPDLDDLRARLQDVATAQPAEDAIQHVKQRALAAALVSEAFRRAGLRVTVVGGAAIEFHAPGAYATDDLDLVVEGPGAPPTRSDIDRVFTALGLERRGRHWAQGTLFVEVPSRTKEDPAAEYVVGEHRLRLAKPEVVLADRIVGFRHWGYTAYGLQALAMLAAFGDAVDHAWLEARLENEYALDAYRKLAELHTSGQIVNEGALQEILDGLRERKP